jgi:hypothetical protein
MRRCVISHIRAPARNQTRHRNIPRLQMTEAVYRKTSASGDACGGLGSIRVPRVGRYVPRRRTFLLVSLFVRSSCCRDNSTSTRDGRAPQKIAPFTARSGRSAYRYENRCDHANGTRDYLAWWSALPRLSHPWQSRPTNCSERS